MKASLNCLLFVGVLLYSFCSFSQDADSELSPQFRINFLNPGIDYEMVITKSSVLSIGGGIGYFGSLEELTGPNSENGFQYVITQFADMQYKLLYNRNKRVQKGKDISHNAGNYISARFFWKGASVVDNTDRLDNNDFMTGITWGFQRSYDKIHILFDVGPVYYFDTLDNSGFFPIMVQLNIGLNLNKK